MLGFFGIFGRSHELTRLDQAVRAVGLHPLLLPEAVKLTTLNLLGEASANPDPRENLDNVARPNSVLARVSLIWLLPAC